MMRALAQAVVIIFALLILGATMTQAEEAAFEAAIRAEATQ